MSNSIETVTPIYW